MSGEPYAPLPLLKTYVKLDAGDTSRDVLMNLALNSASRGIEKDTGRKFWLDSGPTPKLIDTRGRVLPGGLLLVPDIGDLTGLVVETGYGSTWSALAGANLTYSPANAFAAGDAYTGLVWPGGWPGSPTLVRVTARWGWPEVPDEIIQATLIRAAALWKREESVEGVVGSGEWGALRVGRSDPDYASLISRYVIHAFA